MSNSEESKQESRSKWRTMMKEYQDVTDWLELVKSAIPTHDFRTPLIVVNIDV